MDHELNIIQSSTNNASNMFQTDQSEYIGVILTGLMSSIGLLLSMVMLFLITFTSQHSTTYTVIFVRNLCTADVLFGIYGIGKTILATVQPRWVNIFLAESMFFTAQLVTAFTLVLWILDNYTYIGSPEAYKNKKESRISMFVLIFLWNCSLILGFMPQMTWDHHDHVRKFFYFHHAIFIILKNSISLVCYIVALCFLVKVSILQNSVRSNRTSNSDSVTVDFSQNSDREDLSSLMKPCKILILLNIFTEVPVSLYEILHSQYGPMFNQPYSDTVLLFLYLLSFLKLYLATAVFTFYVPIVKMSFYKFTKTCTWGYCLFCFKRNCTKTTGSFDLNTTPSGSNRDNGHIEMDVYTAKTSSSVLASVSEQVLSPVGLLSNNPEPLSCSLCSIHVQGCLDMDRGLILPRFFIRAPSAALLPGHHHNFSCPMYIYRSNFRTSAHGCHTD